MRDRLRKYRKEDQAEKRFGKDINISAKDEAPLRKPMTEAETKSVSEAKPREAKPMAGRSSFGAAFRAARKAAIDAGRDPDKEVFTWRGEKKVARLATDSKPAAPRAGAGRASGAGTPKAAAPKDSGPSPEGLRALRQLMDKPIDLKREAPKPREATAAPKRTEAQQRGDYASRLTQRAAEKRKLESAPTETPGSSLARLKNIVGLGSSADERLAQTMRRASAQAARAETIKKRIADENAAAAARRIAEGKAKAKAGNPFYQSYLNKAKGGKIDGIAIRGKTKIGRK